ncbi:MAG: hypothetical protein PHY59_05610 [Methanobacterium sp.]|nr:hypothetical protein [Methanobacterium sp.]
MQINVEQCRENDMIKEVISKSGLPIKVIKILLRISDAIYINAINYNVTIGNNLFKILLISSKPHNKKGNFNTISLTNIFFRIKEMEKENNNIKTRVNVVNDMLQIQIKIMDG